MNEPRKLAVENLECRRVLAASLGWDGPGAGSAELTYHIANAPNSLNQPVVDAAIKSALDAWSEVADVTFTKTDQPGLRDSLDFSFRNIDGAGSTLAQAYFPDDINPARIAGDVQFDLAESWEVGNSRGRSAFDLVAVAVHEVGHALGLNHAPVAGSVLRPSISPNTAFVGLSQHDIDAIETLYAPAIATQEGNPANDSPVPESEVETEEKTTRERRNPWNRFRWVFRFSGGFHFRGFGRLEAGTPLVHNFFKPTDVNDDNNTTPIDALLVINVINSGTGIHEMTHMCDTNNDGIVSPIDALSIINRLNHPEAEADAIPEIADGPLPEPGETEANDPAEHEHIPEHLLPGFGLGLGGRLGGLKQAAVDSLFDSFDENSDDALTEDEVPKFVWRFLVRENVNTDGNDSVTLVEINAAIESKKLERFNTLDEDDDGLLTESDLTRWHWARIAGADANGDGGVSFDELQAYQERTRFERLDGNGDGGVTEDEVSERVWNRLSHFDANEDQVITVDELPTRPDFERPVSRLADIAAHVFRFLRRHR